MKKSLIPIVALTAALSACPKGGANLDKITRDDTPDLSDLINPEGETTAAAAQVGDPATLLLAAQDQAEHVRGDVFGVLKFLKDATDRDPDQTGQDANGQPFGVWNISDDATGHKVHVIAVRVDVDRVRIVVIGENGEGLKLPMLTGVFVKKGPRIGGGRFDLSLTNFSDLFAAPGDGADGSMHFLFANARPDLHGRRVLYVNVDDRKTPEADPKSFAADLVRLVGVGGRFRSIYAADMVPQLQGLEAVAMRTAWLAGIGGRSDMVVASQANGGTLLAVAHECWDAAGLRTAYQDTIGDNDATDPNQGDTSRCGQLDDDTLDQSQMGDSDSDPELDDALDDAGANDVGDDEAADDSVPATDGTDDGANDPAGL